MMGIPIDGKETAKPRLSRRGCQSTARQIYVTEAVQLYKATLDKKDDDAWKVKRAMRDGWVSQLRRTSETHHRPNRLVVFGSTSHRDVTL